MNTSRRNFLKRSVVAGASVLAASAFSGVEPLLAHARVANNAATFKLKYAPGFGMFSGLAGNGLMDQIRFCKDQGFRAMFDNGLMNRPVAEQEQIANELARQGMDLGPFVLYADFAAITFVRNDADIRQMLVKKMQEGVACAQRTGAKWALVVPGHYDERLFPDYQTANVIENLRACCDVVEKAGLTLVLEPLNRRDHPGLFLTDIPQAYAICKGVNRPSCKIVDDIYHQQISEGNLIPNIESAWSEIASFHLGDNPGRNEPLTGEINFKNIFKFLYEKKYDGVICMEHGRSQKGTEGEQRVLDAYRACDAF